VRAACTAWYLWRYRERQSPRVYGVAAIFVLVEAASALAQGLLVITSTVPISYAAPELPLANIVFWVGVMANTLIGNWILFLLIMLRLVGELKAVAGHDALTGLLNRRDCALTSIRCWRRDDPFAHSRCYCSISTISRRRMTSMDMILGTRSWPSWETSCAR